MTKEHKSTKLNDRQLRHDFINLALRIEIIHQILVEELEDSSELNLEKLGELENSLKDQLQIIEQIRN